VTGRYATGADFRPFLFYITTETCQLEEVVVPSGTPWGGSYRSRTSLPRLFEIVLCTFPQRETADQPSHVWHPVLIVGILRFARLKCWAVDVILGTSNNLKIEWRAHIDVIIQDLNALKVIGLHRPTRFDLGMRKVIPWCTDFFEQRRPFGYLTLEYQAVLEQRLRNLDKLDFQPVPGGAAH
jgi:hypothetical protein